jgi:hypothetical protein
MDFQLKFAASATYDTAEKMTVFLARFGQCTNTIALIFAFVGTSYLHQKIRLDLLLGYVPNLRCCSYSLRYGQHHHSGFFSEQWLRSRA